MYQSNRTNSPFLKKHRYHVLAKNEKTENSVKLKQ